VAPGRCHGSRLVNPIRLIAALTAAVASSSETLAAAPVAAEAARNQASNSLGNTGRSTASTG
jgi:S-adenosylmethionine synthetase